MRKIVLSFDDARSDFYTRAFPILKNYNLPASLNVISGYVNGKAKISFPSSATGMTVEQVVECQHSGLVEIACHGANHQNTRRDVELNIEELIAMGIDVSSIGFASPQSEITEVNLNNEGIGDLLNESKLSYVRSGIQIRREGFLYILLSLLDRYFHRKELYWILNKRNIFNCVKTIIPSAAVFSHTTCEQLQSFIEKMPDENCIIFMFHSILDTIDDGYGKDRYYWDVTRFEKICSWISKNEDVNVCTTKEIVLGSK